MKREHASGPFGDGGRREGEGCTPGSRVSGGGRNSPVPIGHRVQVFRRDDGKPLTHEYTDPDGTVVVRSRKAFKRMKREQEEAVRAAQLADRKRSR